MSDVRRIVTCLTEWLAGEGSLLLLTDYDGTLTPIVNDPGGAWLTDEVRGHLRVLARSPRIRLGVISGRDLTDLRARVAVPEAIYAGCHGLEVHGPDLAFTHPEAAAQQDVLRAVSLALCLRAPFIDGMRVEPKRLGVAVHYRHVAQTAHREMEVALAQSLQGQGGQFKILHGSKVIEILPQVHWNKGACALWIRDRILGLLPPPVLALYMGDDWTDEHVFEAFAGRGITVQVGRGVPASQAAYRLDDVRDAQHLLAALAAAVAPEGAA